VTVSTDQVTLDGKVYLYHSVLEKQTLYSIAKAYGVTVESIYEANPTLQRTGLLKGTVILIPKVDQTVAAEDSGKPQSGTYREHIVKWYETIDDIAELYGVTVDEIVSFNNLKTTKLSRRQVLYIPISAAEIMATAAAENPEAFQPEVADSTKTEIIPVEKDTTQIEEFEFIDDLEGHEADGIVGKSLVNMALILPFNADGRASTMNMDFYAGVLLALRDLQKEGIFTHLTSYDIIAGLPQKAQLEENDIILGPISTENLETIIGRVENIPVISPLDQNAVSLRDTFPNFVQAPSYIENQYVELTRWLSEEFNEGETIILMGEKGGSSISTEMRIALASLGLKYEVLLYDLKEGTKIPARLASLMQKGRMNHVIVASEEEAFVADAMRNLSIMDSRKYKVTSYGTSKLRLMDSVDNSYYHQTSLHLTTAYYVDYSSPDVNSFVLTFRALYKTEPSQFAFQGYDTAYYFISMCSKYGDHWREMACKEKTHMLHLDFQFNQHENGSLSNGAIRRVIYHPDMRVELLR